MNNSRIEKNFTYHSPTEDKVKLYNDIRHQAKDFSKNLNAMCPDCRELSIAMTKLEECVMWANASIARN